MSNKKPIYRYKLTPQIDKQIIELVRNLPPIAKLNGAGEIMRERKSKLVQWSELDEKSKKTNHETFYTDKLGVKRSKLFLKTWSQPLLENHYNNLVFIYREYGENGISEYVNKVNSITDASKKAAENIQGEIKNEVQ